MRWMSSADSVPNMRSMFLLSKMTTGSATFYESADRCRNKHMTRRVLAPEVFSCTLATPMGPLNQISLAILGKSKVPLGLKISPSFLSIVKDDS